MLKWNPWIPRASTESSADLEELLTLHRAFNDALRSCEQSKNKQKQLDAVRELARVDRKFAKVAKTISRKHKETPRSFLMC